MKEPRSCFGARFYFSLDDKLSQSHLAAMALELTIFTLPG